MYPIMLRKRKRLIEAIIDSPDGCLTHLREHATSVIMAVIYGYETRPKNDRLVHVVERMLTFAMHAMTPEREILASALPIVKYIPTWMPGSRFRRDALQCRVYCKEMLEAPFEYTVNAMSSGGAPPSMTSDLLSRYAGLENLQAREAIIGCTSTAFGDSSLLWFMLAMVLHPDVQRRAHAEIDAIVEVDRLPDFGDRSSLPYIDALLREVWRWRPINPVSVPHATSQSDVYGRYFIPKGEAISRSEKYHNPEVFLPERFLSESGTLTDDEVLWTFGAGRRKCVGRYFADALVWSTVVTLLSCFEFNKVEEGWGMQDVTCTSGVAV
ncbi:cytochrome P450 [Chiua virens]|nr:cytochrome P450 [Chiua virens]